MYHFNFLIQYNAAVNVAVVSLVEIFSEGQNSHPAVVNQCKVTSEENQMISTFIFLTFKQTCTQKRTLFLAVPYRVNKDTTKDEVLAVRERTKRREYLKKFERKSMKGFMRSSLKMRDKDMDQDALDYLSNIHDSLKEIVDNHQCFYLVRGGTGPKFCDETGQLQCGATYSNGTFTRAEITCQKIDLDSDTTRHSINYYATLTEHAFLHFIEWDHV